MAFPSLAACLLTLGQTLFLCAIVLLDMLVTLPDLALLLPLLNWFVILDLAQHDYFL